VLLMFGIGLHLDASSLRRNAAVLVGVGIASTLASTAVIALPRPSSARASPPPSPSAWR
jgi:Sodium/hydrogen exchanger family.